MQASTFNSWALSIVGKVVRGRPFFKFLNVPSFVEEIKFSEEILGALESWVKKQYQSLNAEVVQVFKKWPGQIKSWKKTEGTALLPRLKDFIHDVKGSSLPKFDKDKCLELLERKNFDLEDYVQDVYNLLSDSEQSDYYTHQTPPTTKMCA